MTSLKKTKFEKFIFTVGDMVIFFKDFVVCCFTRPFYYHKFIEQMVRLGIDSITITAIIGFVAGLIMTLEFGHGLAKFGGTLYVPAIVSLSIVREMSPILTSLLIAGRIGSGITAEIGSMNVTEQVDAIRALGTSPIRVLVVPKVLATMLSLPLLTIMASFLGILSGMLIANLEFGISPGFFLNKALQSVKFPDLIGGFIKSFVFSIIISVTACYRGFKTRDGTTGVGNSTTWVVVTASIGILFADFFLSKILILTLHKYR
ncbi:MAG: ABC transporter permease [Bacteriovoracaceae bacterium]|nr:ABC transporter permease [Bacteriovoracaceae bacterium]